jgi:hypothetical protein
MSISEFPTVECVFSVVGQHREDADRLLLYGEDGRYYQFDPVDGTPVLVDAIDEWIVEFRLAS